MSRTDANATDEPSSNTLSASNEPVGSNPSLITDAVEPSQPVSVYPGAAAFGAPPSMSGSRTGATTSDVLVPHSGPMVDSTGNVTTVTRDGTAWLRLPNGELINPKNTLDSHSVAATNVTPVLTNDTVDGSEFLAAIDSSTVLFSSVGDVVTVPPRVIGGADNARHDTVPGGMEATDSGNMSCYGVVWSKESLGGVSEFDAPERATLKPAVTGMSHATHRVTAAPPDVSPLPSPTLIQPHSDSEEMLHAVLVDDTNGQPIQLAEIVSYRWIRWVTGTGCFVIILVVVGAVWSRWPGDGSNALMAQETSVAPVPVTASPVLPPVLVSLIPTRVPVSLIPTRVPVSLSVPTDPTFVTTGTSIDKAFFRQDFVMLYATIGFFNKTEQMALEVIFNGYTGLFAPEANVTDRIVTECVFDDQRIATDDFNRTINTVDYSCQYMSRSVNVTGFPVLFYAHVGDNLSELTDDMQAAGLPIDTALEVEQQQILSPAPSTSSL